MKIKYDKTATFKRVLPCNTLRKSEDYNDETVEEKIF